ncbi:MAG TPA: phosphoadenosine phosphosulfate reductase family protein [Ktedonobacteraceae bacterium]|nr:phosphoadenosine phosphosulfate reductase family protein [Ktedonobacteraceae bacterium]
MSLSLQTLPGIEVTEAVNVQPFTIATSPTVSALLATNAPVALGVSGGKDSSAMSLAVTTYLDEIGHSGPRILIHSDLGRVEWRESLPWCQKLAEHLGLELVVVRRAAGDLLDRWKVRWTNNVARYANLETVCLVLPWSTPGMLFCRSELKAAIICRELIQRYPGQEILSPTGIRREESTTRAAAPISAPQPRLSSKTHQTGGQDWHPIADWTLSEVLAYHQLRQFPLHPGYQRGMTRISCAFCVMGSAGDLAVSASCPDNQEVYREQVDLEILSSFAFQSGKWLGDVAPQLLSEQQQRGLAEAKQRARLREAAEARVPKHLKYSKGWPTVMPTLAEARLLAEIRCTVANILELTINYRDAESVLERYAQLMALQRAKKQSQQITAPTLSATPHSLNLWQESEVVA